MNTEYITKPGDRWDLIAYKAYGTLFFILLPDGTTVNAMSYIINNNPDVPVNDVLDVGILLQIPIIPSGTVNTDLESLPPWKQ